jgi:hypothetical protein
MKLRQLWRRWLGLTSGSTVPGVRSRRLPSSPFSELVIKTISDAHVNEYCRSVHENLKSEGP